MVATAEESKWKRLEEKEDEFNNMFVNRNRAYSKGDSYENTGIFVTAAIFENVKERKEWAPEKFWKIQNAYKSWYIQLYSGCHSWSDSIVLTQTNLKPNPTPPYRQLGLTIYQLATGCNYKTVAALFGFSGLSVNEFLYKICRIFSGRSTSGMSFYQQPKLSGELKSRHF